MPPTWNDGPKYDRIFWSFIVSFSYLFYLTSGTIFLLWAGSWSDEANYLVKSWLYVTGRVAPYSEQDPTFYMPLFFYQLGLWQEIFGVGLYSGRLMSLAIGLINLALLHRIVIELTRDGRAAAAAIFLMSTTLTAVAFWTTAAPYASVTLITLIALLLISRGDRINFAISAISIGLLYFLLYFYRPNMIIAIGLCCILQVAFRKNWRIAAPLLSLAAFALCSVIFVELMPERLSLYALRLPIVTGHLLQWGLFPIEALHSATELYLRTLLPAPTAIPAGENGEDFVRVFMLRFVLLYFVGLIVSLAAAVLALSRRRWGYLALSLLFFLMAAGHYIGAIDFCPSCITPYTAYFHAFSCLAGGLLFALLLPPRGGRVPRELFAAAALLLAFIANLYLPYASGYLEHRFRLWSNLSVAGETYRDSLHALSAEIARFTDPDERVLVIGGTPAAHQAIYMAGRIPELTSIHQTSNYLSLRENIGDSEMPKVLAALQGELKWSDVSMRNWIGATFDTIVVGPQGSPMRAKWLPLVEAHFIPVAQTEVEDRTFTVFRRAGSVQGG